MIRVVLGVIGNDIHVVAIKLLEIALKDLGFQVFNLGVNTKPIEFVDAVIETQSKMLLISSLNGEAANWALNVRTMLNERDYNDCILAIGGNLSVGDANEDEVEERFKRAGYDYVFYRKDIEEFLKIIQEIFQPIRK